MERKKKITPKQIKIVETYLYNGGNKTRAYMSQYKNRSYDSARTEAPRLFALPCVREYLEQREAEIQEGKKHLTDNFYKFLYTAATLNITQFFEIRGNRAYLKDGVELDQLPEEISQCVKSIKNTEAGVRIDFYSKTEAITILNRMFGLNKEQEQGSQKVVIEVKGSINASE